MPEKTVTIENTTDTEVAYALADLAEFGEGVFVGRTNNNWHKELNRECVVVLHRETLERFNHPVEAIAYKGSDI